MTGRYNKIQQVKIVIVIILVTLQIYMEILHIIMVRQIVILVTPHQIILTLSMVLEEVEISQEEVPAVIGSNLPQKIKSPRFLYWSLGDFFVSTILKIFIKTEEPIICSTLIKTFY